MIELSVHDLVKYYGANKIFENIAFDVKTGERLGLIGPNGCGKTTLFKILMGKEDYQEGTLSYRKGITIGYLDQMPHYSADTTAMDVLEMAFGDLADMKTELTKLERGLATLDGRDLEKALEKYGILMNDYENKGGFEIDTAIEKIRQGLKIDDTMAHLAFKSLSGGEKTRVILGKILLEAPDLLLLDEPSNHLDMDSIEWLEEFLKSYSGTAVIISHDRYFLDRVVTRIVEMSPEKIEEYQGNYSYYVVEKERRFLIAMKFYMNQQKKIKQMERQIERYRIWGTMRDSDKMFRRAKELEKRLEKMDKVDRPKFENKRMHLTQTDTGRSGKRVLEVKDLSMAFLEKQLFRHVDFSLLYQDSFCILGPNGSGKSTILSILLDRLPPTGGSYHWGSNIKIGYLPQNVTFEDESLTLVDYLSYTHDITISAARNLLAKVLFTNDDVFKVISTLSGGEKSRLKLCSLLMDEVNCMILDEPTNHLDIESREVLEELLVEFEGTILFISHDRYFIAKLANRISDLTPTGLEVYEGDYDDYREEKLKRTAQSSSNKQPLQTPVKEASKSIGKKTVAEEAADSSTDIGSKEAYENRKQQERDLVKKQKALENAEQTIAQLETSLQSVEEQMTKENLDYESLMNLEQEKQRLTQALEKAYSDWEIAQEALL